MQDFEPSYIPVDLSTPPPYALPNHHHHHRIQPPLPLPPSSQLQHHRPTDTTSSRRTSHKRRPCQKCQTRKNGNSSYNHNIDRRFHTRYFSPVPFLIHKSHRPHNVRICGCTHQKAHLACVLSNRTDVFVCNVCDTTYHPRYRIFLSRLVCMTIHLLSIASVVGLVFGLAQLGSALDKLGLGSEAGTKIDGDETWQDQELQQILEWLQLVHFATGVAGEALLGLVYVVGVCGVIGLDRTLQMLDAIIHINLEPILRWRAVPDWVKRAIMCTCLVIIGLVLGTYLLFYSWIWACLLCHFCYRILNVRRS